MTLIGIVVEFQWTNYVFVLVNGSVDMDDEPAV
jgi:hypothetical protein